MSNGGWLVAARTVESTTPEGAAQHERDDAMSTIRALLKAVTTAGCAAVLLLVGGAAAWARVLPPDPAGAPSATNGSNPAPAASGTSSRTSVWEIALPVASALVAIALTMLLTRVMTAHRNAGRRAATT